MASGVDSHWLDAHPRTAVQPSIQRLKRPWTSRGPFKKLASSYREDNEIRNAFSGTRTFTSRPHGWGLPKVLLAAGKPDLFHFHWVSNFLDWEKTLPELAKMAPIVWSLHDLNPTLGTWHYVPAPFERTSLRDRIERDLIEKKRRALAQIPRERLIFVCPSRWMAERCRASKITSRFEAVVVPYGVDPERFYPIPKEQARASLGIHNDQPVIGFMAYDLSDPRKGMDLLLEAFNTQRLEPQPLLLTMGRASGMPINGIKHQALGTSSEDQKICAFYSACDLFVCPSRQDNLPNTVLESLACGTPVAGFHIGGLPDMVIDRVTGGLAAETTSDALGAVIANLLADRRALAAMAPLARDYFIANFSEKIQTKAAISLYHRMLHL